MGLEDGGRIIVEMETVDTQVQSLLPVQPADGGAARPELAGSRRSSSLQLVEQEGAGDDEEKPRFAAALEPSHPPVISHNPLSPHASMTALRNKKSSLLIHSLPTAVVNEDEGREHEGTPAGVAALAGGEGGMDGGGGEGSSLAPPAFTTRTLEHHHLDKPIAARLDEEARSIVNYIAVEDAVDQDSTRHSKEPSTKADFFAARLASAVGENEISDSEETFVYESTANSTKNSYEPISSNLVLTQSSLGKPYGIPAKLSTPMLTKNKKLLERLKTTRHSSIAVMPSVISDHATAPQAGPAPHQPQQCASQQQQTSDDLKSIHSNRQRRAQYTQMGQSDIQSVKSFNNQPMHSPGKRLSVLSLTKAVAEARQSRNTSNHSGKLRPTAHNNGNSGTLKMKNNHLYPLRTTASRIFDANGASLRRYSGVPDNINLEDYVEQENGELTPNKFTYRSSSEIDSDDDNVLNEDEGLSYVEEDEDDVQSMFYYHGNPQHAAGHTVNPNQVSSGNDNINHNSDKHSASMNNNNGSHVSLNRKYKSHYGALGKFSHLPHKLNYEQNERIGPDDDLEALYYFRNNSSNGNAASNGGSKNAGGSSGNNNNHSKHFDFFFHPDELSPLKSKKRRSHTVYSGYYNPHNFYTKRSTWNKFKSFVYLTFIVTSLLALGFISGFLLATNKELHDFQIKTIDNVLASADELVFDIKASSFNPGFFTVGVQDVNLDIFAKTSHLDQTDADGDNRGAAFETVLLGTVYTLETPLRFQGGFLSRNYGVSMSGVKLLHPGAADTAADADKWRALIRYEFDLIVRGNMKYSIPFFKSEKSVVVQAQTSVDPNRADVRAPT
ncbi:ADL246Wp [Eremothecium gossypii ATCC 10895]|uniref:ADL246Wp n=1 Tax=Eremothecium gossypii (strain ATCC 10895 / CBS 109.51 / FGSC 9923 / NRRL Y-1056) TaxID=284811 RepID=Q75B23_EREGS|nr:ADL246Wp [Eremothecium gossypii ATCC 10895]AAS51674.1 ADL246Wp [Eremothecium gossypii ATCC 10895]AEY95971.1 FADL246Wp [Eremothecium gossypii FDAG1]